MNKKIILTGAAGFIGSNFLEYLIKKTGHEIVCILNKKSLQVNCFQEQDIERVKCIYANLFNYDEAKRAIKDADYVIHMAGRVGNAATVNDLALYTDDITLTANVARAAAENGIEKMLYCSSSTGYKNADYPIKESEYFDEEPAYFGYGWMRRYIEKLLEHLGKNSQMKIIIARAGAVYGCYDNFDLETCHFIPALIKKYLNKDSDILEIWGSKDLERDLMFAEDFVEGCMAVFEKGESLDAFNVGVGRTHTIIDVIDAIEQVILEQKITEKKQRVFQSDKPAAIPFRCLDVSKLDALGFKSKHDLISGIRKTIKWLQKSKSEAMELGRDA